MSAEYENEPSAIVERALLLDKLRDVFAQNMAEAAIHFTDNGDSLTVLAGAVEPFDDGARVLYKNLSAFAIYRTTHDWQQRIVMGFGPAMFPPSLHRYDIVTSVYMFGRLTEEDAKTGRQHIHRLQRTQFSQPLAESCKYILFNQSRGMLSPWHKLLGVGLPERPSESEIRE